MFKIESVARAVVEAAHFSKARAEIKIDTSTCSADQLRELFDEVIAKQSEYSVRVRGVRSDWSGFRKLGLELETANSANYEGIPVVLSPSIDFDCIEFVIEPK